MKCKIIREEKAEDAEVAINQWLSEHPKVKIRFISQLNHSQWLERSNKIVTSIFYDE